MKEFYLFEAGSTKTALVHWKGKIEQEWILPGYNPNRDISAFVNELNKLLPNFESKTIYFYGSGLENLENQLITCNLFKDVGYEKIDINHDLLGAARAALQDSPGIIAIMGTGGIAAYYDGKQILKRQGGHGYLINDLGGGFEMGKRFISYWLDNELSTKIENEMKHAGYVKADFIRLLYAKQNISSISGVVPIVFNNKEELSHLLESYFDQVVEQLILPLHKQFNPSTFSVVGSIGEHFKSIIQNSAVKNDIRIGSFVKSPIYKLMDFHAINE